MCKLPVTKLTHFIFVIECGTFKKGIERNIDSQGLVKATIDGTIILRNGIEEGMRIAAGETIGYILPEKGYVIEGYIPGKYYADVYEGQETDMKIEASEADNAEYKDKSLKGTIIEVEKLPTTTEAGNYYKVTLELDELSDIAWGSECICSIILGQRRVKGYFLEPYIESLRLSMKEK